MSLVKPANALALIALVATAAGLTGCADVGRALSLDPGGVDPGSPIAARAVEASRGHYEIVEFASIPKIPGDVAPAALVKSRVAGMVEVRRDLARKTSQLPAAQTDTEGFSQRTRDPLLAKGLTPPAPDQDAQTDAYVQRLRALSQPPGSAADKASTPEKPKTPPVG